MVRVWEVSMKTILLWLLLVMLAGADEGVVWYGSWKEGLAAARTSHHPILLVAAAPHCHNVPGVW